MLPKQSLQVGGWQPLEPLFGPALPTTLTKALSERYHSAQNRKRRAAMTKLRHRSPPPIPAGWQTRLLGELERNKLAAPPTEAPLTAEQFITLYRDAIERLEQQVAQADRHPPMRKQEVDLLCRCLLSCLTLEQAIRCAAEFCAMLHPRAGALSLDVNGDSALFRMDSLRQQRSSAACLVDLTGVFCYLQLFGWLIGQPLQPAEVLLPHPKRDDAAPFLGLFNAPVTVGQATYGFRFDTALLARPVIRHPSELAAFLQDFPFRLVGAPDTVLSWAQQVRGFLHGALIREQALPMLTDIAAGLGVSEATLRRRLAAESSSYQALREACLREEALRCLSATDWPLERIAGHLGFSSEAAFRRAFQRWTGQAPSRLRAQR
jgi:AraC-like DNA-binding protein